MTDGFTTMDLCRRLGVPYRTVNRWAWGWHGRVGSGNPRSLTAVDALVARAWSVLTGSLPSRGSTPTVARQLAAAETAIRADPRRWLLIAGDTVDTFDYAETAALAWVDSGQPAGQLIDLWSTP